MAQINFDASLVAPSAPREPIDDGWYPVIISASEIKPTSAGDGLRLAITLKILPDHPHFANRQVFEGLNIQNPNPVAQQIAQEQLSAICHATGVIQLQDTEQLHNRPFLAKLVTVPTRTDTVTGKTYEAKNEVKAYGKLGEFAVNLDPPKKHGTAPAAPAWQSQPAAVPAGAVASSPSPAPAQTVAPVAAIPAAPAWAKPAEVPAPAQAPVAAPAAAVPSWATQPAAAPATVAPNVVAPAVPSWAQGAQA